MDALWHSLRDADMALFLWMNARADAGPIGVAMWLGSVVGLGVPATVLAGLVLRAGDRRAFLRRVIAMIVLVSTAGGVGQWIKSATHRQRPVGELSARLDRGAAVVTQFAGIGDRTRIPFKPGRVPDGMTRDSIQVLGDVYTQRSFPSGHAITGFCLATCLWLFLRRRGLLLFLGATWIAVSRVYVGAHFPLDSVAGALIGSAWAGGWLFVLGRATSLQLTFPARRRRRMGRRARVMIVAGEASADLYGANLARALAELAPGVEIVGVGGARMEEAGVELVAQARDLSIMGFTAVLFSIRRIRRIFLKLWRVLRDAPPDALVPIDLPDFNLLLAGRAKELGIPVCYYISPQVWAWRRGRVRKIARRADRMVVAFPFEKELYEARGLDTRYVGHPLVEIAKADRSREEAFARFGLDPGRRVVAVLPGSRESEIRHILGPLAAAVDLLAARFPDHQFALPVAPTVREEDLRPALASARTPIVLVRDGVYDLLSIATVGLIASGTATLEAALFALPMVIVYRGSAANIAVARRLVKVDFIGLPNLIAGRRIVTELIQEDATPEAIAGEAGRLLADPEAWMRTRDDLAAVRASLAGEGTSRAVARIVLDLIGERRYGAA